MTTTTIDVVKLISDLREWSATHLAGKVITVASGKGGVGKTTLSIELAYCLGAVLVDLDWDDGCASRALGWRHETRVRSPLLDALATGRAPRLITGGTTRPDLVPSGPDLGANQPRPAVLADALEQWGAAWGRPIVVDTHPGGGEPTKSAAYGALMAASAVCAPVELGERELDATAGWCAELDGYRIVLIPNRVPRIPPASQLDWLDEIAGKFQLTVTTDIPDAVWLPRRKSRTALCGARTASKRSEPQMRVFAQVSKEVGEYAAA